MEKDFIDKVLPADLEEATALKIWSDYCLTQVDKCAEKVDGKGTLHWGLDYERAINDLKYLQFKKIDSERKMKNEKRDSSAI